MLPMEVEDGLLLPRRQPEIPGNPTVVFIHAPVALSPVVELAGPHAQPVDESSGADLGLFRPTPNEIHHQVPHIVRHPHLGQSSPRLFLKRCARPSTRPTPRPWSGSSSPGTRFVVVRLDGPRGPCPGRRQRRSRRTLFASGRIPLAATPVAHTDRKRAPCPTSAVSGWQPSLLRCSAFAVFPCVLSVILTEERPLQFQLRQDIPATGPRSSPPP